MFILYLLIAIVYCIIANLVEKWFDSFTDDREFNRPVAYAWPIFIIFVLVVFPLYLLDKWLR